MKERKSPNGDSMDLLGLSLSVDSSTTEANNPFGNTKTSKNMLQKPHPPLNTTANLLVEYSAPLTPIHKIDVATPLSSPSKTPGLDALSLKDGIPSSIKSFSPGKTVTPKHKIESKSEKGLETSKNKTPTREPTEAASPKTSKRSSLTPPARFGRKLLSPWSKKKVHQRSQSLDTQGISLPSLGTDEDRNKKNRSSAQNTPTKKQWSPRKKDKSISQNIVDERFTQLQMPSLAKPSPTSFLMGKDDEVIRTSEVDATPHQVEIPTLQEFVVTARLIEFVDGYRRIDQNFDLQQWAGRSRLDLLHQTTILPEHKPILQALLDCGDDISPQGTFSTGTNADERVEVMIFEGQRQFIAVFRGSTEQQNKAGAVVKSSKKKQSTVPLDGDHKDAEVFSCFRDEYQKLEKDCFQLLDRLTEENPFFDVVFAGYSFGAGMATLAAFRYANARAMMRVSCLTLGSPKVGMSSFKNLVNSSPNLKVMRLEFGQDGKCQTPNLGGFHVGHTLVLHSSLGQSNTSNNPSSKALNEPVQAYKFETPKFKKFKTVHPDLRNYISGLEEMALLRLPWVTDFVGTSGKGVVVNNETRQVV